jgi:hypothetical protein
MTGSMRRSPTLEAFRLLFRHPSFGLAEIAWRWSFGAAALLLCAYTLGAYFNSLTVSPGDMFLLRTRQPALIGQAIAHIFRGSGGRLISGILILFLALSLAWIIVASLGRAATLGALHAQFRNAPVDRAAKTSFASLLGLNFLRAAVLLATFIGSIAALGLGGLAASKDPLAIRTATQFSMALLLVVWGTGYLLNWFLSLAAIFTARVGAVERSSVVHKHSFNSAILAAFDFCQHQFVAVLAINTWFGFAHLAAAAVAVSLLFLPLSAASILPWQLVLACAGFIALFYFALSDFISVGKFTAYVCLLEFPPEPALSRTSLPPPVPPTTAIDPDELILSDLPLAPSH